MFKYAVIIQSVNINGGVSATITMKDTKKEAEDLFFDTLSKTGGNPSTKALRVELKNEEGNTIKTEVRINEVAEPIAE